MALVQRLRQFWLLSRYSGAEYARRCGVQVGDGCRIISRKFGSEPFLITIGNRVTVADGVRFLTHDGSHWLVRDGRGRRFRYARIDIDDDVFVGAGAILMPGVRIGSRSIISAGAVVTKSVPPGSIVAGVPARIIGEFDHFEKRSLENAADDENGVRFKDFESWVLSIVEDGFMAELTRSPGLGGAISAKEPEQSS